MFCTAGDSRYRLLVKCFFSPRLKTFRGKKKCEPVAGIPVAVKILYYVSLIKRTDFSASTQKHRELSTFHLAQCNVDIHLLESCYYVHVCSTCK